MQCGEKRKRPAYRRCLCQSCGARFPLARRRMIVRIRNAAAMLAFCLASGLGMQDARAHLVETGVGPIYNGIAHFALSPEDILPAFALAVFAGLRGKGHARIVILLLPIVWLLSGIVGLRSGVALGVPLWVLLVTLGALVAADMRLPIPATAAIAMILGGLLGLRNGAAMTLSGADFRELLGVAGAVFVLTTLISAGVLALSAGWLRIAWRAAGSWIAASGLLLLGWALNR